MNSKELLMVPSRVKKYIKENKDRTYFIYKEENEDSWYILKEGATVRLMIYDYRSNTFGSPIYNRLDGNEENNNRAIDLFTEHFSGVMSALLFTGYFNR